MMLIGRRRTPDSVAHRLAGYRSRRSLVLIELKRTDAARGCGAGA